MTIRIGILGYGNLGRGVECALEKAPDMELAAVFTRRDPAQVKIATANVPVVNVKDMADWKNSIDVLILCGGSATDLPVQTPEMARMFNVIDSFDTHARIPEHFAAVDKAARFFSTPILISSLLLKDSPMAAVSSMQQWTRRPGLPAIWESFP